MLQWAGERKADLGESSTDSPKSLWQVRKQHIEQVLQVANYDEYRAAGLLGLTEVSLRRLMRKLKIPEPGAVPDPNTIDLSER